jgi:DNA polymerase I-like protein with 3'-5' exonuclease and polymerase domains
LTGRIFPKVQSLQTLAKEQRNILEAEPDCYFIEYDFSAFEFNILLDIFGEDRMKDPHLDILKHLGVKADRKVGKSINYSFLYGMSAERVVQVIKESHDIDIDLDKLKNYPLFKKKHHIPIKNGIIETFYGRPIKIEKDYAAFHNYIQGTSVDIFVKKMRKIINLLPNDEFNKIILQNHDSILIQLHESVIEKTELANEILEILKESTSPFTFEVDVKYGKVWSELI